MTQMERTLTSILRQAERIRPTIEADEQMYYLVGSIIANAEDALGALKAERDDDLLAVLRSWKGMP